jgi:hypothetical protein
LEQGAVEQVVVMAAVRLTIILLAELVVGRVRLEQTEVFILVDSMVMNALVVAVAGDELCPAQAARVEILAGLDLAPMVVEVVLEAVVVALEVVVMVDQVVAEVLLVEAEALF